eukprot:12405744-Karenia_brevis.AAC.1
MVAFRPWDVATPPFLSDISVRSIRIAALKSRRRPGVLVHLSPSFEGNNGVAGNGMPKSSLLLKNSLTQSPPVVRHTGPTRVTGSLALDLADSDPIPNSFKVSQQLMSENLARSASNMSIAPMITASSFVASDSTSLNSSALMIQKGITALGLRVPSLFDCSAANPSSLFDSRIAWTGNPNVP